MEVHRSDAPFRFRAAALITDRVIACFGSLHEDFSLVSAENPARIGEIVHLFLTGLRGAETIPNETPNPTDHIVPVVNAPQLSNPNAFEVLFFGLAPGLVALQ